MYFVSRQDAGIQLASQLIDTYRYENIAVVALTDGAVQVAWPIAAQRHGTLSMLLTENIDVPGEGLSFGTLIQNGHFNYNGMMSAGEIEEYYTEFHGFLEDQKREKTSKLNQLLGAGGIVNEDMLRGHVVILVSDGLKTGASLEAAADFLKPLQIKRFVVVSPVAAVPAVDRAHILADELHILSVPDNYMDTNHYYDVNELPSHEETVQILNDALLQWQ